MQKNRLCFVAIQNRHNTRTDYMDVARPFLRLFGLCLMLSLPLAPAFAASDQQAGFLLNEQQLREQQQRLKARERQRLLEQLERSLAPSLPVPKLPATPPLPASDVCFSIGQISLQGAENLTRRARDALIQPWLDKCMSLADIETLRGAIERHYIENGWILARAYLKPGQNIRGGELVYVVREGKLDEVRLNANQPGDRMQAATAFAGMLDESVYLRDIEQGLDQINRLQSVRATMKIEPVRNRPGSSRLLVQSVAQNPLRLTMGFDNQGSQSTGEQRSALTIDGDNLFSVNDNLYIHLSDSVADTAPNDNRSYSLSLTIPYGYWLYSLGLNRSRYTSLTQGESVSFVTAGVSDSNRIDISRVVHRDAASKTAAAMVLNIKDTQTYLEDVQLQTGTRRLVVADIRLQHVARLPAGSWSIQLTYSRGLPVLGALRDAPLLADDVPRAQFEKLSINAGFHQAFEIAGVHLRYAGNIAGQSSRQALYGSEQLALGSLNTVRGFRDSPVSGDSGIYLNNSIQWSPAWSGGWWQGMTFSVGLDVGTVRARNNNINNSGIGKASLAGVAIAVRQGVGFAYDQQLNWSLSLGRGIHAPDFVDTDRSVVMFSLGWKFW